MTDEPHCWNCGFPIKDGTLVTARNPSHRDPNKLVSFHERCLVALQARGHGWERAKT